MKEEGDISTKQEQMSVKKKKKLENKEEIKHRDQ